MQRVLRIISFVAKNLKLRINPGERLIRERERLAKFASTQLIAFGINLKIPPFVFEVIFATLCNEARQEDIEVYTVILQPRG